MNKLATTLVGILAVGLGSAILGDVPVSAQTRIPPQAQTRVDPRAEIRESPVQLQINSAALIKVNTRTAVQFRPFEVLDPTNRRPISRDTMLPELPNGKRLTAGQYYDELNRLEQRFNTIGYTLKEPTEAKIELQVTPLPSATLQRQVQMLQSAHLPNTRFQPLNLQSLDLEHKRMIAMRPNLINLTVAPTAKTVHWVKDWNYNLGDPGVFSAYINGKIELNGTKDVTKIDGLATAGGSIFSHGFELLSVSGNLNSPKSGTMNAKVGVSVIGIKVYNLDQNVSTGWSKSDTLSKTLDKSVSISFALGPIPMNAKFGVQGTAGISYGVAIAPVKASANVAPFVHTKVYAQVGVDIVVAGAGAGANLTLLNTDGHLNGALSIEVDSASKPYFKWTDSYSQSLDMLSGNVYVYAYVYVPCWHVPPWCKNEWDWNVFNWSGFKASGYLFNDTKTLYLY